MNTPDLCQWMAQNIEGTACVITFVLAALLAILAVPPVIRLAWRIGAIDVPGGRHIHQRSTPRLGGLALLPAILLALPVGLLLVGDVSPELVRKLTAVLATGTCVCLIGVRDDIRPLSPFWKLLGIGLAAVALVASGVVVRYLDLPFVGRIGLGSLAGVVTIAWVVGVTNAINLIDGVDGLGAGLVTVASGMLALVAFAMGEPVIAVLLCAIAGACAGFLLFNRQPARIFLGDSGALFLGFLVASISVSNCTKRATALFLFAALCALAVPLFDSTHAFVRRFRQALTAPGQRRILRALQATAVGDRGHLHHRLLFAGLTHRQVARKVALMTLLCSLVTMLLLPTGEIGGMTIAGAFVGAGYVVWQLAKPARPMRAAQAPTTSATPTPGEHEIVLPAAPPRALPHAPHLPQAPQVPARTSVAPAREHEPV